MDSKRIIQLKPKYLCSNCFEDWEKCNGNCFPPIRIMNFFRLLKKRMFSLITKYKK